MKSPAEYRDIEDAPRSKRTTLKEGWSEKIRKNVKLISATKGYEPAGSMARWTDGYWAVHYIIDGAINGRRYRTEQEAQDHFNRLVMVDQ